MDRERMIKLTTNVAIISIFLLIYWIFIFITMTVFGLKIFRENMTEIFYMSVMGIFAIMGGALITNVILNLSRIGDALSENRSLAASTPQKFKHIPLVVFLMSFPVIFLLLYTGDQISSKKKQAFLIKSAKTVIDNNAKEIAHLADYSFGKKYVKDAETILSRISRREKNFPSVSVVVADRIGDKQEFLDFSNYSRWRDFDKNTREDYIFTSSAIERDYLGQVFGGKTEKTRFSAHDGFYELYYPVKAGGRIIVLYFTDRTQYGKLGS